MADLIHDVAVTKFRTALQDPDLSGTAKPYVTLALIEALVRSSSSPQGDANLATEALAFLEDEDVFSLDSAPVWKAEALASLGRYQDADEALAEIAAIHPHYNGIQLTRARILLALERVTDALDLLVKASQSQSLEIRNASNLLASEIHIDLGQYEIANATLEKIDGQNPSAAKLKEYLEARLALSEGKTTEAISSFQSLITAPNNLSEQIFHACILGKADAQAASNQREDAIATLEQYIEDYPDSLLLESAFSRLSALLPDDLAEDSPSLVKLRTWSGDKPQPDDTLYISGESIATLGPYQPDSTSHDDLASLALYHRALLLARTKNPDKQALAMALLARLRSQHANSSLPPSEVYLKLSSASLLDTAYLHLKQNQPDQATFTLSVMEKVAFSPRLKSQASYLRGLLLNDQNKPEEALSAFDYARQSASADIANASTLNAAMMALKSSDLTTFDHIASSSQNSEIRASLLLEQSLWKCSQQDPLGRSELESFIINHPDHPRENEARLALAASSVMISPPDIILAKAQLEIIAPLLTDAENQFKITKILIRAEELTPNWLAAAEAAKKFTTNFQNDPNVPSLLLKQGEAYFHNEDYNKARRILQDVPEKYPDSPFSIYASFYAAMSARLGGTAQSREECIAMFQKIIDSGHPLARESRIQQSRVLIDLRQYSEAEQCLEPLLKSEDTPASLQRAAGVLMADCLHRQGSGDPAKYEQAIKIYDQLLAAESLPLAWKNRLHFLRGQTYEGMSRPGDAFGSYYDVLILGNAPSQDAPHVEEWYWFYRCGFKALSMLEGEKRWEAAVKLARRMASFSGYRAEEAAKRANSLAKNHMIWEDVDPTPIEAKPVEQDATE